MKKYLVLVAAAVIVIVAVVVSMIVSSDAVVNSQTFGFGTPGVEGKIGELVPLGSTELSSGVAGQRCNVHVQMNNNESVHIRSQLWLVSDTLPILKFVDVEATPFSNPAFDSQFIVGKKLAVYGIMGEDPDTHVGGFSGGGSITLTCDVPNTTTTTVVPTTTTTPHVDIPITRFTG